MNFLIGIAALIQALASIAIATHAWRSYRLSAEINKKNKSYEEELKSLYQALLEFRVSDQLIDK